jgi:hypothetical protein
MSNINWITPKRSQNGGGKPLSEYAFSFNNHKGGKADRPMQGSIRVSQGTMKKLRWIAGDRVMVGCDESNVYIKRVQAGGYALAPVGGTKNAGKTVACSIKTSRMTFSEPKAVLPADFALLDDGTVMIEVKAVAL